MGKSDPLIFSEYRSALSSVHLGKSVAFLGFSQENDLTKSLNVPVRHFYDLSLGNWNINDDWFLKQQYDLIVCTRCAYFSKDPKKFISKVMNHLNHGGHSLIDWGLGDHWRFKNYKVGWVRDGEHEYAYSPDNFLYSCFWNDEVAYANETKLFWDAIKSKKEFAYNNENLEDVVKKEIPHLIDYPTKITKIKFLWPESPQLYIITLIKNEVY